MTNFSKKKKVLGLGLAFVLVLFSLIRLNSYSKAAESLVRAVGIEGVTKVQGQDTVVKIWVAVKPGENASEKAREVLRRAYPDAREIKPHEYSLTGLVWDQFSDSNAGNDYVTVNYNGKGVPSNISSLGHRNTWLSSQATWTNVDSSKFVYSDGGDTGRCPSLVRECKGPQTFDGKNDVGWLNISDPSVLGVTWYGTQTDEFDMALDNKNFTWHVGDAGAIPDSAIDAETVWLHEFGHGLGLGHSKVNDAVMEPYYEGVRRTLHQDDIDGIVALYPSAGSSEPTPTPTPTPTPVPGATVSVSNIVYTWYGGKNNDRHLDDTLTLIDNNGNPIAGASVSITLTNIDTLDSWTSTGSTSSVGTVTFSLKNASNGCYETTVDSVTANGLNWDGQTPANDTCHP